MVNRHFQFLSSSIGVHIYKSSGEVTGETIMVDVSVVGRRRKSESIIIMHGALQIEGYSEGLRSVT